MPTSDEPTTPMVTEPIGRTPRTPAVRILAAVVVVLILALGAVTAYFVSADRAHREREDQLATQVADGQRKVQELQAQVASARAEAEKAKAENASGGADAAKVQQLSSCSDALKGVLGAKSGSDFSKAFKAMQELCVVAGIPLF
jgi:uncharacterized protein HemX